MRRDLPARPHLDHVKHEAKALRRAFEQGDAEAVRRVEEVLDPTGPLKLTEAQRALAREYGFASWAKLRAYVAAARGLDEATDAFLLAASRGDRRTAQDLVEAEPHLASSSLHVAAVLGLVREAHALVADEPARVHEKRGELAGEPLLWLCHSPFHGESAARDEGLLATARVLLDAGADPAPVDGTYGIQALYAVTGVHNAPRIARLLLEAGADPTDGESVFHAAEKNHVEALELLLEFGVELNHVGDWGNTAPYFLVLHQDVMRSPEVFAGLRWLLAHGADPNVRSGRERETCLHAAARRGQALEVVRVLLDAGADVHARRDDGRTAWTLARRGGHDDVAALLERAGAVPELLSDGDLLLGACGRGDADEAARLATPEILASLTDQDRHVLPEAASAGRDAVVRACLGAGLPVDATDGYGATALHHAAIHGRAALVRALLSAGADFTIIDPQHRAPALGWACFGADWVRDADGDYEGAVRALLEAGARLTRDDHQPAHEGVRAVLDAFG